MSTDLRELARLAKPVSGSPGPGFDTADSSGYVDLSAFSTSDAGWVDRELARARNGAPPPPPRTGSRAIEVLTPQSMAPVSLEAFEPEDTMSTRTPRGRKVLTALLGVAAVGVVGFLAFTLARHPPPAADTQATTAAAAIAPPPTATPDPAPPPAVPAAAAAPATVPPVAAPPATTVALATTPTPKKKPTFAPRAHPIAAAPAAPSHAAPLPAVVIPKAKPAAGNDSLMDLIKKSVATGK